MTQPKTVTEDDVRTCIHPLLYLIDHLFEMVDCYDTHTEKLIRVLNKLNNTAKNDLAALFANENPTSLPGSVPGSEDTHGN